MIEAVTAASGTALSNVHTFAGMMSSIFKPFGSIFGSVIKEASISIAPLFGLFIVFQIFLLKMTKRQVVRLVIGFIYSFVGLSIFLVGVNGGFMQAGRALGELLGQEVAFSSETRGESFEKAVAALENGHITRDEYEQMKQDEQERNTMLLEKKENVNSNEYIEQMAREQLGLVMPNETIYVDSTRY